MTLRELTQKSYYVANGYVDSLDSISLLESYIVYNLPFLQQFQGLVIATTYREQDQSLLQANKEVWTKYFPDVILIDIKENRGHGFGIADSENALVEYCQVNNIDWVCKSSNDVIIQESLLDKVIPEADFYYYNGISYEDLYLNSFDYNKLYTEHLFPQTNFYYININKVDYLYDKDYINTTYEYRLTIENYNNKIWEYIPGWSCELFLKACVERNNLIKHYLLDMDKHNKLCNTVNLYKIGDPSHKNILVDGVCHLQYPDQKIIEI
jgi:hypothetical protein